MGQLRRDAELVMTEARKLGLEKISEFDNSLLRPVQWHEDQVQKKQVYICDRCGFEMFEKNCKITCPNCGNRFDCSDLNIYFD